MTTSPPDLEVDLDDLTLAAEAMDRLAAAGGGWIDVVPAGVDPPPPTSIWGRINGRGPSVPRLTWTAPTTGRRREQAALGIEHATGTKAFDRLAAAGHPTPAGWRRLQDHPMRGLVVEPAPDATATDVLRWGLRAVQVLAAPDVARFAVRVREAPSR